MPHECTDCGRVFADGSKEMLSGCPDCGGTTFQFHADEETAAASDGEAAPEPPEPPDRPGGTVARTVGKTAATVRDLVGGSGRPEPERPGDTGPAAGEDGTVGGAASGADEGAAASAPSTTPAGEDDAQASARSGLVAPDELPTEREDGEREHRFDPTPAREAQQRARDDAATDESSGESTPETASDSNAGDDRSAPPTMAAGGTPANGESAASGQAQNANGHDPEDRPDLSELRAELNDQFESIKVLQPGQYELNLMELYDREEYIIALQEDGKYSIQVPEAIRASGDD